MDTVLITTSNFSLPVKMVNTFQGLDLSQVSCLIYHSSIDSEVEVSLQVSQLKGKVEKVIYINNNINPLYYCFFTGLDADIYDTEDVLLDADTLDYLVSSYKSTGMTLKSPNADIDTLAGCVATISSGSFENVQKLVSNTFWLRSLSLAVSNVDTALTRANEASINMIHMLDETAHLVRTLQTDSEVTGVEIEKLSALILELEAKHKEKLSERIEELQRENELREEQARLREEELVAQLEAKTKELAKEQETVQFFSQKVSNLESSLTLSERSRPSTPFIFSTYTPPLSAGRVLYVRGLSPCQYLTTFLVSYRHYLRMMKQTSAKLLLVFPKHKMNLIKYKDLPRLAPDNIGLIDLNISDVFVTFDPTKAVLDAFFGQTGVRVFLVADMLLGEALLEGHQVEILYAMRCISDFERFDKEKKFKNFRPDRCFFPVVSLKTAFHLGYIKDFTQLDQATRLSLYMQRFEELYARLDKMLLKERG